jgi:hypothetical protein
MPQIPLYNKGLGPQVRTATGRLSPRASSAAFEQVGLAQAQLGRAISDVSKVAAEFEVARQDAETDQIAEEYSNQIRDAYRTLNSQPTSDINEYRESERVVRQGFMDGVDEMGQLGSRQKQALKDKVNKYAGLFSAEGEKAAFTRFIGKASETANKRATNILGSITSGTMPLEMGLAEYNEHYDRSVARGYAMDMNKEQFRFAALGERLNLLALDDSKSYEELDAVEEEIMRGQGDYAGLARNEREALAGVLSGKMQFLENEALVDAQTQFDNAKQTITNPYQSALEMQQAVQESKSAIQTFRRAGQPEKARSLEIELGVNTEVAKARDRMMFASRAEIINYTSTLEEQAVAARGTDQAYEMQARVTAAQEFFQAREKLIAEDPALYVTEMYKKSFGRVPTMSEIIASQTKMGIADGNIKVLTSTEIGNILDDVKEAKTTQELTKALVVKAPVAPGEPQIDLSKGRHAPVVMRQLREAGLGLAANYIANAPSAPMSKQLFAATQPGGITINVTDTNRDIVQSKVRANTTVQNHLKSLLGGSYMDLEQKAVRGASSDTNDLRDSRLEHVDMLTDLTVYLIQEDGKILSGEQGIKIDPSEIDNYVTKAAKVLDERYEYITFETSDSTSLRLPKEAAGYKSLLKQGMISIVRDLTPEDVFFESGDYEQGSPEYNKEREFYLYETKGGFGWIASNDGKSAVLVDRNGGAVFRNTIRGPEIITVPFFDGISAGEAAVAQAEAERMEAARELGLSRARDPQLKRQDAQPTVPSRERMRQRGLQRLRGEDG